MAIAASAPWRRRVASRLPRRPVVPHPIGGRRCRKAGVAAPRLRRTSHHSSRATLDVNVDVGLGRVTDAEQPQRTVTSPRHQPVRRPLAMLPGRRHRSPSPSRLRVRPPSSRRLLRTSPDRLRIHTRRRKMRSFLRNQRQSMKRHYWMVAPADCVNLWTFLPITSTATSRH